MDIYRNFKKTFCETWYHKLCLATVISVILVLASAGCVSLEGRTAQPTGNKVKALATLSVLADMVREVGKERVEVGSLVPVGRDTHTFQPTPRDSLKIREADVIFFNGMGLEVPLEGVIKGAMRKGVPIVVLSDGALPQEGNTGTDTEDNPHLWLDVRYAIHYVERIRDALATVDPKGAAEYEANARTYIGELRELDRYIERAISSIPPSRRKLVTFHDAFPYFAERYGLEIVGLVLKSPGREPSAREVAELAETIKSEGVSTVYTEPQFNAHILELIARDAGIRVSTLYSDALDENVPTYLVMMKYNVEKILEGLK